MQLFLLLLADLEAVKLTAHRMYDFDSPRSVRAERNKG